MYGIRRDSTVTPVAFLFASNRIFFAMVRVKTLRLVSPSLAALSKNEVWEESRFALVGSMVVEQY